MFLIGKEIFELSFSLKRGVLLDIFIVFLDEVCKCVIGLFCYGRDGCLWCRYRLIAFFK